MKPAIVKIVRCSRCRDVLSAAEQLGGHAEMCGLCGNIHAEALDICRRKRTASTPLKATQNRPLLRIVPKTNQAKVSAS